jgi:hypothetical protein
MLLIHAPDLDGYPPWIIVAATAFCFCLGLWSAATSRPVSVLDRLDRRQVQRPVASRRLSLGHATAVLSPQPDGLGLIHWKTSDPISERFGDASDERSDPEQRTIFLVHACDLLLIFLPSQIIYC